MAEEASSSYEEERHDSWSELPPEVLSLIYSHLFGKADHDIFGAVCKLWKSVTAFGTPRDPLSFDFSYGRSPFLMTLRGDRCDFFHPTYTSYYLHIPELLDKRILDSKYGWLLVAGTGDQILSIFFFHLVTKEKICLPNVPPRGLVSEFSFNSLPTSPECVVVATDNSGIIALSIFITKPGEENWTEVYLYYKDEKRFRYGTERHYICCTPVFHDGKCYCLDENGKMAVFDLNDIENSWNFCGKPYSKIDHRSVVQSFMVETDGELLTVFLDDEARIWICKLNPITREWMDVKDLGNKVLYLSNRASWAERDVYKGMDNKIYLPMLYPTTNTILFYSLATGKFHSHGHDFGLENFYHMKQLHQSTWIEPWY